MLQKKQAEEKITSFQTKGVDLFVI